jgi:hypothetical protein
MMVSKFAAWKRVPALLHAAQAYEKVLPRTATIIVVRLECGVLCVGFAKSFLLKANHQDMTACSVYIGLGSIWLLCKWRGLREGLAAQAHHYCGTCFLGIV